MLGILGPRGTDNCDGQRPSRRTVLTAGGSSMLGLSLAGLMKAQQSPQSAAASGGNGWGKAKSVIMVYLQGGPSHIDLWDPKENVPDNVRSVFKPISTEIPGVQFTELLPQLAR